ncbi:potassium-transporting ATPase subunit KdpA [Streptomyces sp. NPDC004296]|uniref:potassium-transporting ATPase subunit KdpA n=1 Tax=Streptomyces sp. NPDC004296 TaxID=3364697 RepID=UPI0036C84BFB
MSRTHEPRSCRNSPHSFENPNGLSDLLEIFLLLVIPFSMPRTFGRMVGSLRQGYAIVAAMGVTAGTPRTEKPLFTGLLVGTLLIVTGLTFFPALALGPLAEGLSS